jgi:hypothetical protein
VEGVLRRGLLAGIRDRPGGGFGVCAVGRDLTFGCHRVSFRERPWGRFTYTSGFLETGLGRRAKALRTWEEWRCDIAAAISDTWTPSRFIQDSDLIQYVCENERDRTHWELTQSSRSVEPVLHVCVVR